MLLARRLQKIEDKSQRDKNVHTPSNGGVCFQIYTVVEISLHNQV